MLKKKLILTKVALYSLALITILRVQRKISSQGQRARVYNLVTALLQGWLVNEDDT